MSSSPKSTRYFVPNSTTPPLSPKIKSAGSMSHLECAGSSRVPFPSPQPGDDQKWAKSARTNNHQTPKRKQTRSSPSNSPKQSITPLTPPPDYSDPILPRFSKSFPSLSQLDPDDDTPPQTPGLSSFSSTSPILTSTSHSPSSTKSHRRTISQTTTTTLKTETTRYTYSVSSTWDSDSDNNSPPSSSRFSTIKSTTTSTTAPSASWPSRPRGASGAKVFPVGGGSRQGSPTPFSLRGRSNSTSSSRRPTGHTSSPARHGDSPRTRGAKEPSGGRRATQSMFGSTSQLTFAGEGAERTSYFSTGSIWNSNKPGQRAGTKSFSSFADRTRRAQPPQGSTSPGERPFVSAFGPGAVTALTDNTLPYFRPFMNLFIFLIVSTVTAVSVSCVLLASFSLTFYDDIRRGVGAGRLQIGDSFEGMRAGARRVLGGAKEALEVVTRAAGSGRVKANDNREAPAWHTASEGDDEHQGDTPSGSASTSQERNKARAGGPTPRTASCSPSPFRKAFATAGRQAPTSRFDTDQSTFTNTEQDDFDRSWLSDEAPPFDVPPTTPRQSRPATPKPGSSPGSPRMDRADRLPPRPPLKVLVPSVVFALVWTMMQLVCNWWTGRSVARAAGQRAQRGGR